MSDADARITLALPSKGALYDKALETLAQAGLKPRLGARGRDYVGVLEGVDGVDVLMLRADEIPERVETGDVHVGLTGEDLFRELGGDHRSGFLLMRDLGFGHARLTVAVPRVWIDVATMTDLDETALQYRRRHGRALRVATKFPRLTRQFFQDHGIVDYMIVRSMGATEGAPASGAADLIVDLASSGATLIQNHLKEIEDGVILRSQACLVACASPAVWNDARLARLAHVVEMLESRLAARRFYVLRYYAVAGDAADLAASLRGEPFGCELLDDAGTPDPTSGEQAVLCPRSRLYEASRFLRDRGCRGVTALTPDFVFRPRSSTIEGFRATLAQRSTP